MSQGWECPKCGNCYAPFVRECEPCNTKVTRFPPIQSPDPGTIIGKGCLVCGSYHANLQCPAFTAKTPEPWHT